jgi:acetyl-CoA carboxylase biotin carboxylase subunit
MGAKAPARELVDRLGVPVVPGSRGHVESAAAARAGAERISYPVAVKASSGGGGIGFRVAGSEDELEEAVERCAARASGLRRRPRPPRALGPGRSGSGRPRRPPNDR